MTAFAPEFAAGGFTRLNGTVQFYQRVHALLSPEMVVLDFGAGRGAAADVGNAYARRLLTLKGQVQRVIGVDVDPVVTSNPLLDEAHLLKPDGGIPLPDGSVDLIVADWVFEHIEHPERIAAEIERVLKPGGWLCARTPNRFGYIALGNRLIPDRLKDRTLGRLQTSRKAEDVFPAFYRMNHGAALRAAFPPARWRHHSYFWDAEPAYHGGRKALYRLFSLIHAVSPPKLKTTIFIFLQKAA